MELFVEPGHSYTFLLELILTYLKLQERHKVKLVALSPPALKAVANGKLKLTVPSLVTAEGEVQTDIFAIASTLLSTLPQWRQFFLGEELQASEIANIKSQFKQGKQLRKNLQKYLQSRTFFVGNHLTYADLFMFTQLYDNLIDMTDEQKLQYHNLFRWYKHIQNLPQVKEYLNQTKRFLVTDPTPKLPFLSDKKKQKKEKKEDLKPEVKPEVKPETPSEAKVESKNQQKITVPSEPKQQTPLSAVQQPPASQTQQ